MFKAVMFQDPITGSTPTIHLAFFLHEQRDTKTHTKNVLNMSESCPELEMYSVPFVVDGDKAIFNAW